MQDNRSRYIIYAIESGKVLVKLSDYAKEERRCVDLHNSILPSD